MHQAKAAALSEENAQLKSRLASARPATTITVGAPPTTPTMGTPATASANTSTTPRPPGTGVTATFVVAPPGGAPAPAPAPSTSTGGVPTSAPTRPQIPGARYHTVTAGDTLSKISTQYYGTPGRWAEILVANREVLGEDNNLVIGRQLRIP
jgi:nucleoid-associated protein YgaU